MTSLHSEQRVRHYLSALLGFSTLGVLLLYTLLRVQGCLPLALGNLAVPPGLAFTPRWALSRLPHQTVKEGVQRQFHSTTS